MSSLVLETAPALEPISLLKAKNHLRIDSGSLEDNLSEVQSILSGSHVIAADYSLKGAGVEVLGYDVLVILTAGTCGGGGSVDVKLQESDTDVDANYTDVAAGAFGQVTTANDEAVYELAYSGTKKYIRAVATVAGAACEFGVVVIRNLPISMEDDLISGLIVAARERAETFIGRALITQTWNWIMDRFPGSREILLPLPPLQSVVSFTYKNAAEEDKTIEAADYIVDTAPEPGRVVLAKDAYWPIEELYPVSAVQVQFIAGYGDAATDVPQGIRQACLLMIGEWYENRENITEARSGGLKPISLGAQALLWPYRLMRHL